jgi:hypothetical protein
MHPHSERSNLPKRDDPCTATIERHRLDVILQRLQHNFYAEAEASTQIAAAVLPDLMNLDESSQALPQ